MKEESVLIIKTLAFPYFQQEGQPSSGANSSSMAPARAVKLCL